MIAEVLLTLVLIVAVVFLFGYAIAYIRGNPEEFPDDHKE